MVWLEDFFNKKMSKYRSYVAKMEESQERKRKQPPLKISWYYPVGALICTTNLHAEYDNDPAPAPRQTMSIVP